MNGNFNNKILLEYILLYSLKHICLQIFRVFIFMDSVLIVYLNFNNLLHFNNNFAT